ncbi:type III secretion apparatus protein, YscR/HrcR family [Chelatococcus sambhunathii]|uniref:EscR/YscR/HrcR family type III secretion system export apparatus protein n=2 Tax=Chelatococcus TaxID=28209 RepID=A0AAC9P012_9HYPH|nr:MULTISPECIES: type III secretion system export apparatus subunit SctR [Chelatococcus]APF38708.1 EscR/YscR/HrcR family type III secretion system export apparatus protein [Chelatococcus daeguensis]CUA89399.1 type III secretion apparatus protein, YscR/HrcR family [Chelatococcus sambhunathii]
MGSGEVNLLGIAVVSVALGLLPFFAVLTTGFLKIAIVLMIVRNALGVQQTPPNVVLYAVAIVLTVYVSAPLLAAIHQKLSEQDIDVRSVQGLMTVGQEVAGPLRDHLARFATPRERQFFLSATQRIWPQQAQAGLSENDFVILLPAYISSELTRAFQIGFLLYLPFLVIDLVVSNILMAMGMMMVSPMLISVPLKLFLFVAVDGWSRLMHGLILSYA